MVVGVDHTTLERMKELDLFGLNMRRLSRHLFAVCSCITGRYREDIEKIDSNSSWKWKVIE